MVGKHHARFQFIAAMDSHLCGALLPSVSRSVAGSLAFSSGKQPPEWGLGSRPMPTGKRARPSRWHPSSDPWRRSLATIQRPLPPLLQRGCKPSGAHWVSPSLKSRGTSGGTAAPSPGTYAEGGVCRLTGRRYLKPSSPPRRQTLPRCADCPGGARREGLTQAAQKSHLKRKSQL